MSKEKEIINKLIKIVANQQQIITKIAQVIPTPSGHNNPTKKEAAAILNALPPEVRASVENLAVLPSSDPKVAGEVKIRFHPGKETSAAFNGIMKAIQSLQQSGQLSVGSYNLSVLH